jgi:hypothetical protein
MRLNFPLIIRDGASSTGIPINKYNFRDVKSDFIFFNPMRKSVGLYLSGHLGSNNFWENVFSENSNTKSGGTKTVISL